MKNIQKIKILFAKHVYASIAAELLVAILLTIIPFGSASAGQLSSRSIMLSESGPSGGAITTGVGNGLNVVYKVAFNVAATTAVGGIVIDFCSNSALAGDSCTAPLGMNTYASTTSTISVNNQTNLGTGAFAVYTGGTTTANRVILTRATATVPSGASSFELGNGIANGIANPTVTGTVYARIYTYPTNTAAQSHNQATPTGYTDFGGVAISIASVITITARVQENLTFCVSASAPTANCGGLTTPAVALGHGSTATSKVIDATAIDTGTVYTQLSTNAQTGATVRIHSSSTTGGLDSPAGGNIPPVGAGASTPSLMVMGTAAFGLKIAAGSGGTGTVTAFAPYNSSTADTYGFDTTTSGSNAITTFGSSAQQSTAPTSNVNNLWTFAATASNTTSAGIYSANITAVATGVF